LNGCVTTTVGYVNAIRTIRQVVKHPGKIAREAGYRVSQVVDNTILWVGKI
jgi:hypothetical protein